MKTFIFSMFFVIPSYAQNFMMSMNIEVFKEDTVIIQCGERVIWGIKGDTICFIWSDVHMCFFKKKNTKGMTKHERIEREKYIKKLGKNRKSKDVKVRDLFYNKWKELYLITIYMDTGAIIFINRLGYIYPYYSFEMTN